MQRQSIVTEIDPPALDLIRETRPQIRILPMVQNLIDEKWDPELLARAVANDESRQRLIKALTTFVEQNKFGGVCIDLKNHHLLHNQTCFFSCNSFMQLFSSAAGWWQRQFHLTPKNGTIVNTQPPTTI